MKRYFLSEGLGNGSRVDNPKEKPLGDLRPPQRRRVNFATKGGKVNRKEWLEEAGDCLRGFARQVKIEKKFVL